MIRIEMTCQDSRHPDRRERHSGRARCEVDGRRFEAMGPAAIYRIATLLCLHGHGGERLEVWDNVSPTGGPGGLAMRGRVRNWTRLVKGKPSFDRQAKPVPDFTPDEVDMIARAAGRVSDTTEIDSPAPGNAHRGATRPSDGPEHHRNGDGASTRDVTAHTPEAA